MPNDNMLEELSADLCVSRNLLQHHLNHLKYVAFSSSRG
jgi:hypothetical protein